MAQCGHIDIVGLAYLEDGIALFSLDLLAVDC
jgi:hypothetical protein